MLNGKSYIYLLTDSRNGLQYVGKSNGNAKYYFSGGKVIKNIVKKYGRKVFLKEILEIGDFSNNFLNALEKHYIKVYDTFNNGYNLTKGGDDGAKYLSEESKYRVAKSKHKKIYISDFLGNLVKCYNSIKNASKDLEVSQGTLSKSLHNNLAIKGKYQASFSKNPGVFNNRRYNPIKVYKNDKYIGTFSTALLIAEHFQIPKGTIHNAIKRRHLKKYNLKFETC